MGLVIDVFIAFLFKLLRRTERGWGSRAWPMVEATIESSSVGGGWIWNCPTTEVVYRYEFNEHTYRFADHKPFFSGGSAQSYVARFSAGKTPFVRVNPRNPSQSILRRADQPDWDW